MNVCVRVVSHISGLHTKDWGMVASAAVAQTLCLGVCVSSLQLHFLSVINTLQALLFMRLLRSFIFSECDDEGQLWCRLRSRHRPRSKVFLKAHCSDMSRMRDSGFCSLFWGVTFLRCSASLAVGGTGPERRWSEDAVGVR